MLYCPKCSAPGPFTQEGLSPLLVRPVDGAPAAKAADEKQPAAEV